MTNYYFNSPEEYYNHYYNYNYNYIEGNSNIPSEGNDIQNIVNQGKKSEIAPNSRPVRFITTQVESPEEIQRRRLRHDNMQKRIKVNIFKFSVNFKLSGL